MTSARLKRLKQSPEKLTRARPDTAHHRQTENRTGSELCDGQVTEHPGGKEERPVQREETEGDRRQWRFEVLIFFFYFKSFFFFKKDTTSVISQRHKCIHPSNTKE